MRILRINKYRNMREEKNMLRLSSLYPLDTLSISNCDQKVVH